MSSNLEIKARVADAAALRALALPLATERLGVDMQTDTYFRVPRGRLKLRESSLSGAQLIPYQRPDRQAAKRSDYLVIPVEDPQTLRALLGDILGVQALVRKRREILLHHNVRIHLDEVEGLGSFMELEAVYDGSAAAEVAERQKVVRLCAQLGVAQADLIDTSYEALISSAP